MAEKTFNVKSGIGKARHVVSFHDGVKTHKDGSPFFDVRVLRNKREVAKFVKDLSSKGFELRP